MKQIILPKQDKRKLHTSAIFDSGPEVAEIHANAGVARSAVLAEAVHDCVPILGGPVSRLAFR